MRSLRDRIIEVLPFIIGYALIDAWSQIMFSGLVYASLSPVDQLLKYAVAVLPGPVFMLLAPRFAPLVRRRYREVLYLFGMAGAAGSCALLLAMQGAVESHWSTTANVLLAVARVCLLVCWFEKLCGYRIEDLWLALGGAMTLGAAFKLIVSLLPIGPYSAPFVLMPLLSCVFLPNRGKEGAAGSRDDADADAGAGAARKRSSAGSSREAEGAGAASSRVAARSQAGGTSPAARLTLRQMFAFTPWALVVVLGLVNVPSEALVVMQLDSDLTNPGSLHVVSGTVLHLAVNLAAIVLAALAVRKNIKITFYLAIPAILIASTLLAVGIEAPISILHTVSRVGSEAVRCMIIFLLVRAVRERGVPAMFCFSLMMTAVALGTTAGFGAMLVLGTSPMSMAMLFCVVLVVAMLFLFAGERFLEPDRPAEAAPAPASATAPEDAFERFAERYGLTPREAEVMELWATGRSTPFIEEQLSISKYTVKTHVKHIYEKTGAGTKEELISQYEAFRDGR